MGIDWSPGIGDPTIWGWLTVVAYFSAATLSMRAARRAQFSGRHWQRESTFWIIMAFLMLGLGINKQLDFQSLLTEIARMMAKEAGWYGHRRTYQSAAILFLATGGGVAMSLAAFTLRESAAEIKLSAIGLCALVSFIVIRAASFHHVDALISKTVLGISWNAALELPGIFLICGGAFGYARRFRSQRTRRLRP